MKIVVAASKSWNRRAVEAWHRDRNSCELLFIERPEDLTVETLDGFKPGIVFFLHWSWKISRAIFGSYECILFHMTDLPYGRGGSPLQNLIANGETGTMISAIRVVDGIDAGPVYLKRPLSLCGTAEEIFVRAADVMLDMIDDIVARRPVPVPQTGEVVTFRRRTAEQSRIDERMSLDQVYDAIRMLDAEGYPRAFITVGSLRFEFSRASVYSGRVVADVSITRGEKPQE